MKIFENFLKKRKMKSNFLNQIDEIGNYKSKLSLESVVIDGVEHKPTVRESLGEATITYSKEK
jgi:hypothetical protein